MRQRIHLTESQLYGLVEQALNEISTQTKMSAANKAYQKWRALPNSKDTQKQNDKLYRQQALFTKGVESDVDRFTGSKGSSFVPATGENECGTIITHNGKTIMGSHGRTDYDDDYNVTSTRNSEAPIVDDFTDYLRGASYYENGEWRHPGDERKMVKPNMARSQIDKLAYDKSKAKPWATQWRQAWGNGYGAKPKEYGDWNPNQKENESMGRRVNEEFKEKHGENFYGFDDDSPIEFADERAREDIKNYVSGRARYIKGKGWSESVAHRVTESIMRKLRRM